MTITKYGLTGFANLRDGGGLVAGPSRVRTMRLLRSNQPSGLDEQDVAFLRDLPLAAVIDLRTEMEVTMEASPFKKAGFHVERHSIMAGSPISMIEGNLTIPKMYHHMIKDGGHAFAKTLNAIASALEEGSVLVHCTAGKDRTGITIALIQDLLGVSRDDIVASYALTEENLRGQWLEDKLEMVSHFLGEKEALKMEPLMVQSPPEAMRQAFAFIDSEYGGTRQYLAHHGVEEDIQETLARHLLVM